MMTDSAELLKTIEHLEARVKALESRCYLNDRYTNLLDILHAGVVVHGPDTSILMVNPAAEKILGLSRSQLLGKQDIDPRWHFCDVDGAPLAVADYPVNQVIQTGLAIDNFMIGISRPEKKDKVWVLINATPIHYLDELREIVITFIDITQTKNTLAALRNSEVGIQNIIDRTPLGVCVTNNRGIFESVNNAYCDLYGYGENELIGQHFTMVVPDAMKPLLSDLHDQFIQEGAEIR